MRVKKGNCFCIGFDNNNRMRVSAPVRAPYIGLILPMEIEDPWNPTSDEIEAWAFNSGELEPIEDWDFSLVWKRDENLYLALASNVLCPRRQYFLHVLYLSIGEAVRTDFRTVARPVLERFIDKGERFAHPDIALWVERSRALLADPAGFNTEEWCGGKLAGMSFTDKVP